MKHGTPVVILEYPGETSTLPQTGSKVFRKVRTEGDWISCINPPIMLVIYILLNVQNDRTRSDKDCDGCLTIEEFSTALTLIKNFKRAIVSTF